MVIATTTPFTGSVSTLTAAAGTVPNTSAALIPAEMTLALGGGEAVFFDNAASTVRGTRRARTGWRRAGPRISYSPNAANTVTDTLTINPGAVAVADPAAVASYTDIRVNGRSSTSTPGFTVTPATGTATPTKPVAVADGFVPFGTGGGMLSVAGVIGGSGGVPIDGGNVELTNAANNSSGRTRCSPATSWSAPTRPSATAASTSGPWRRPACARPATGRRAGRSTSRSPPGWTPTASTGRSARR